MGHVASRVGSGRLLRALGGLQTAACGSSAQSEQTQAELNQHAFSKYTLPFRTVLDL